MSHVPPERLDPLNDAPLRSDGDYVVYWMVTQRRLEWNFALDQALGRAREFGRPLLVFEALRAGYQWASRRHHQFVIEGMREHRRQLGRTPVGYLPYVEPVPGAGRGLLEALAQRACVVVTDDYPVYFVSRMQAAAASRLGVRLERVDSNGLLPMRAAGRTFTAAVHFRRHLQKHLGGHLMRVPDDRPLGRVELPAFAGLPEGVVAGWPSRSSALLDGEVGELGSLSLAYDVAPVPFEGGVTAGRGRLDRFLGQRLARYGDQRNEPDDDASSRLSPWLHWGHLSAHEVFHRLADQEGWSPARISGQVTARREGWWGMSSAAESFLDELVTWRELGFNFATERPDFDRFESVPQWARTTLAAHASDPRDHIYDLEAFAASRTHDPLWNAAQRELVREGTIHNYLRMLWGKKILEWSPDPRTALAVMIELNNRYAIDGRDPNSYSGIFWVLGRFDRGWPERPVYGTVRSMSSASTRRKVAVDRYLKAFAAEAA